VWVVAERECNHLRMDGVLASRQEYVGLDMV
jgi:hypothetical protein